MKSPPDKVDYKDGETLTLDGLVVMCKFTDGTETDVSSVIATIPVAGTEVHEGDNLIDIRYDYQGLATFKTQQIIETTNPVVSLTVTTMPNKVEYTKTEILDITGLVVTATYHNGETVEVTNQCTYIPAVGTTFEGKGQQHVQISFTDNGISVFTTYEVNVKGELVYHGVIYNGTYGEYEGAASIKNIYALFAGDTTNVFNSSLVHSTTSGYTSRNSDPGAGSIGEYAIFAGDFDVYNRVYANGAAYNSSLVKTSLSLSEAARRPASANIGDYLIFAGGNVAENYSEAPSSQTTAITSQLVTTSIGDLSYSGAYGLAGASVGNYAVFAGGQEGYRNSGDYLTTVITYNSELVRGTASNLSRAVGKISGTETVNHALFAGALRSYGGSPTNVVNVYDKDLVRTTPVALSSARDSVGSGSLNGEFAMFAGGSPSSGYSADVDVFDVDLLRTNPSALSVARSLCNVAEVGEYLIVGGGSVGMESQDTTEAYKL